MTKKETKIVMSVLCELRERLTKKATRCFEREQFERGKGVKNAILTVNKKIKEIKNEKMMGEATNKQRQCIEHLRNLHGDDTLLQYAKRGKWVKYNFDFDNLSKVEAQRIINIANSILSKRLMGV